MSFPASDSDRHNQTRFFYLLDLNDLDSMLKMVRQGHDINMYDKNGKAALHHLVERGFDAKTIERFLDAGADVNKPDLNDKTPLILALEKKDALASGRAELMIRRGADMNCSSDSKNFVISTLMKNPDLSLSDKVSLLNLMVKHGASLDVMKSDGMPLLSWSIGNKTTEMRDHLLQKPQALSQTCDEKGETPLLYAIREKANAGIINRLIEKGSDVNCVSYDGTTPLKLAVRQNNASLICKLLDHGATPTNVMEGEKQTPLLIWACQKDHADVARKLIEKGASLDVVDDAGVPGGYYWEMAQRRERMAQGLSPLRDKVVWKKTDEDRITRSEIEPSLGRELRDIFNFTRRERLSVLVDPKSQHIDGMVLQGFDQMPDKEPIREALEEFKKQGGKADPMIINTRVTPRTTKPLPRQG